MIIDTFRNFIEIESLQHNIDEHNSRIQQQKKRISDLMKRRSEVELNIKEHELKIHDLKIKDLELQIATKENSLSKLKSQINLVKNEKELTSLNHEIEHTNQSLQKMEETYFSHLELLDQWENLIKENKQFLIGSQTSLQEISSEVDATIKKEEAAILNYQKRIEALLESELPATRKLYLETQKKFLSTSPCSFLINKNCSLCRINVDSMTVQNVEHARSIEQCPNCGRILLPRDLNLY